LAEMFYRGDLHPHRTWSEAFTELKNLTRQHEFMTSLLVQAKLNARSLLDQVCPAYETVFDNLLHHVHAILVKGEPYKNIFPHLPSKSPHHRRLLWVLLLWSGEGRGCRTAVRPAFGVRSAWGRMANGGVLRTNRERCRSVLE